MSADAAITGALTLAQTAPIKVPHGTINAEAAKKAAKQFEGVMVSQMLGGMFEGISTDGMFGGGQGEQMFRSLLMDEYSKEITKKGGFGLSDAITKQLLAHQETAQ